MDWTRTLPLALALVASPFLFGVINRTKAFFAGRKGQPLLQMYFDISKLLRKGVTYSSTTSWIFRFAPVVMLGSAAAALVFVPMGSIAAPASFPGDILVFVYLLAMMRFATISAALDTGSSFEGMGSSREAFFSAIAEPALLLGLAVIAYCSGSFSLSEMYAAISPDLWARFAPSLALTAVALGVVLLVECSRIPIDDPNTHLELTMIHEVMILDTSGPDLAFAEYAASLKYWAFGALFVGLVLPVRTGNPVGDIAVFLIGMIAFSIIVGAIESSMARIRMTNVPRLIMGAVASALLAWALILR